MLCLPSLKCVFLLLSSAGERPLRLSAPPCSGPCVCPPRFRGTPVSSPSVLRPPSSHTLPKPSSPTPTWLQSRPRRRGTAHGGGGGQRPRLRRGTEGHVGRRVGDRCGSRRQSRGGAPQTWAQGPVVSRADPEGERPVSHGPPARGVTTPHSCPPKPPPGPLLQAPPGPPPPAVQESAHA